MSKSFFGFGTALPTLGSGKVAEYDEFYEEPDENIDHLNDLTFGDAAIEGDWEQQHEKFTGDIGGSQFELEQSLNQLVVDDDELEPRYESRGQPIPSNRLDNFFGPSSPPGLLNTEELVCGQQNIWGSPVRDSYLPKQEDGLKNLLKVLQTPKELPPPTHNQDPSIVTAVKSMSSALPNARTLEEIEQGMVASRTKSQMRTTPQPQPQPVIRTLEDLEHELTSHIPQHSSLRKVPSPPPMGFPLPIGTPPQSQGFMGQQAYKSNAIPIPGGVNMGRGSPSPSGVPPMPTPGHLSAPGSAYQPPIGSPGMGPITILQRNTPPGLHTPLRNTPPVGRSPHFGSAQKLQPKRTSPVFIQGGPGAKNEGLPGSPANSRPSLPPRLSGDRPVSPLDGTPFLPSTPQQHNRISSMPPPQSDPTHLRIHRGPGPLGPGSPQVQQALFAGQNNKYMYHGEGRPHGGAGDDSGFRGRDNYDNYINHGRGDQNFHSREDHHFRGRPDAPPGFRGRDDFNFRGRGVHNFRGRDDFGFHGREDGNFRGRVEHNFRGWNDHNRGRGREDYGYRNQDEFGGRHGENFNHRGRDDYNNRGRDDYNHRGGHDEFNGRFHHGGHRGSPYNHHDNNNYHGRQRYNSYGEEEMEEENYNKNQDEYAGLMTKKEKDWVIKIQMLQLQSENPYLDDFYYTSWAMKRMAQDRKAKEELEKSADKDKKSEPKLVIPHLARVETKGYKPVQFENSLGRVTASSVHNPRQIIDIKRTPSTEQEDAKAREVRRFKELLLDIEKGYDQLLEVDDLEKKALGIPEESRQVLFESRHEKIQCLYHMIQQRAAEEEGFIQVLNIRKGILLVCRLLPLLPLADAAAFVSDILQEITAISKKDWQKQVLPLVYEFLIPVIKAVDLETLVGFSRYFHSSSQSPDNTTNTVLNALQNKFGCSVILCLISRGETIYATQSPVDMDIAHQQAWNEFVTLAATSVASLSKDDLAVPHQTFPKVSSHVKRVVDKRTFLTVEDKLHAMVSVPVIS